MYRVRTLVVIGDDNPLPHAKTTRSCLIQDAELDETYYSRDPVAKVEQSQKTQRMKQTITSGARQLDHRFDPRNADPSTRR